jgi:osomolarity two-component system response regulator SKN7
MITSLVNMYVVLGFFGPCVILSLRALNDVGFYVLQSWTFRHPDFHAQRRDALENIKRKVPTQRKSLPDTTSTTPSNPAHAPPTTTTTSPHLSCHHPIPPTSSYTAHLQSQIERLTRSQDEMTSHIRSLERNHQDVLVEMVNFQRNMTQQDGLMQNLIQYILQGENGKWGTT